mgnify:CR=1 FL=1
MIERKTFNKSNILKLIFFCIIFFNTDLEASNYTYKNNSIIRNKKISKIYLANNTEKKIESVTATGFGTSLEKASQNAATNALTQVVGSFIDAETIIKEQTNINNGIVEQTSIIKEDISDYSQGSIKYFEILDVRENGSLYEVTARVDVKIEDFRAYIKKLASGSSAVSKELSTGLFTKAVTNEDNLKNKYNLLLKNIIDPIRKAEVYKIEIGDVKSLDDWQTSSKYCSVRSNTTQCSKKGQFANHDRNRTFVIPFSISLEEDFRQNMKNTLENISDRRIDSYNFDPYKEVNTNTYRQYRDLKRDYVITVFNENKKNKSSYILKDIFYHFKKTNKGYLNNMRSNSSIWDIEGANYNMDFLNTTYLFSNPSLETPRWNCSNSKNYFSPMLLKFLDENKKNLEIYEFSAYGCNESSRPISILEINIIGTDYQSYYTYGVKKYYPEYSLWASGQSWYDDKSIHEKRNYVIVAELELNTLKNLRSVEIEFFKK